MRRDEDRRTAGRPEQFGETMVVRSDRRIGPSALEMTAAPATAAIAAAAESLQSTVELVLGAGGGVLTDDQRRLLETGWRNGRRLLRLIGDLHTVALVEGGRYEVDWAALDLRELATRAAEAVWPVAHATRKPLRVESTGSVHAIGAEEVLGRTLEALLGYVVEHARRDAEIVVAVGDGSVSLEYRAAERLRADDLPVALAQAVAHLHGGELVVGTDDELETLTISLGPVEEAAQAA